MSDGKQFEFKAWVELAQEKETRGGKLHVHGQAYVKDETLFYQVGKKDQQGYYEDELFLEIKPDPTPGTNKVELKYHEDVPDQNKYKKITIFANNEQVMELNDIEKK